MPRRQPLPTRWLMTDERLGEALWEAVARLPRGGGVVFRHYGLPQAERRRIFAKLAKVAHMRQLTLVRAGRGFGYEASVHNSLGRGLRTASAHSRREAVAAVRRGAKVVFVSPVFATRSHPGARTLGVRRLRAIYAGLPVIAIALGGMDEARFRRVRPLGIDGWAGIDAWLRPQKLKAVPT